MKLRKLGQTQLEVSQIGIGCSGYWGNKRFPERRAQAVIVEACEAGINFFDTGHNYCNFYAEPRLGRILKRLFVNHDRSKFVISTKAGTTAPSASPFAKPKGNIKNFSPDYIEQTCALSIRNLNCGYLDIFQLHGVTQAQITPELLDRLAVMRSKGMFRYLGVNTHNHSDMLYVAQHPELFDMVLLDYNPLQLDREPAIQALAAAGVGVVAGTVLAQGHLIPGKITSPKSMADLWYLARALGKPAGRVLYQNSKAMREVLASIEGVSSAQAAFAFALANQDVSSCVFGTTNLANLTDVLASQSVRLTPGVMAQIRETYAAQARRVSA